MRARRRVERVGCMVRDGGRAVVWEGIGVVDCGTCLRTAWTFGNLKILAKRGSFCRG